MSGSVHHGTQLADKLRTPWGISVVTCNTGPADTSFVHQIDLPRVNTCDNPGLHVGISPELTDFSKYSMACSWLLKLLLCW